MNTATPLTLSGPFALETLGHGVHCLRGAQGGIVILRGAALPPGLSSCAAVTLTWPAAGGVRVNLSTAAGPVAVAAASALVHEPAPDLYAALPLATFDAGGRRFWRRVFLIVRIPGGRLLLGLLARRARGAKPG